MVICATHPTKSSILVEKCTQKKRLKNFGKGGGCGPPKRGGGKFSWKIWLCHAYKLLSTLISKVMYMDLEGILPESQAVHLWVSGSRDQCDGEDDYNVKHRMNIAQARYTSLLHLWTDHCLSITLRLNRLYCTAVCLTFSHAAEAKDMTETAKKINGFNSRCLHIINE